MDRLMLHAIKLEIEKAGYQVVGPFRQASPGASLIAGSGDDFTIEVLPTVESESFCQLQAGHHPHELAVLGLIQIKNSTKERFTRFLDIREPYSVDKLVRIVQIALPADGVQFESSTDFYQQLATVFAKKTQ